MKSKNKIEFDNFRNKWGLGDFKVFVSNGRQYQTQDGRYLLLIIHKDVTLKICITDDGSKFHIRINDPSSSRSLSEIKSVSSFVKNARSSKIQILLVSSEICERHFSGFVVKYHRAESFENVDEFKKYILIRKLAGL